MYSPSSALLEPRDYLLRYGCRFQPVGIVRVTPDQHASLERLDRQRLALEHLVGHLEAGALEALDPAFDRDPVAMGGSNMKLGAGIDHGNADQAVFVDDILLRKTGGLEHDRGRIIEHREVARVIDDVGGVAIAPLDLHVAPMDEHRFFHSGLYSSDSGR